MSQGRTSVASDFRGRAIVPRLPTLNQKAATLLEEHGWTRSKGGKHAVKMTKRGWRPITLPHHHGRDYSKGLTRAILRQAGID